LSLLFYYRCMNIKGEIGQGVFSEDCGTIIDQLEKICRINFRDHCAISIPDSDRQIYNTIGKCEMESKLINIYRHNQSTTLR
jgi:hypothetical protein